LRVRYAIHDPQSDDVLARHLDEVTGYWRERSHEQSEYSRAVYVALLNAHQDLLADPAIRLYSAAWWSAYQPQGQDVATMPAKPPLSAADPSTVQCLTEPPEEPSSDVAFESDATIEPPDATAATSMPGVASGTFLHDRSIADVSVSDGQLTDGGSIDQVRDLMASRIGDDIELSWIWPSWATTAAVSWDIDGMPKSASVDREEYRPTGRWRMTLSPGSADDIVEFSVVVRGAAHDRQAWSAAVRVLSPRPYPEVTYKVRRLWHRFPCRTYKVYFYASRRPVMCEIMIGFSGSDALPETPAACEELDKAFLATEMSSRLVTLHRNLGRGWLRCFFVEGEPITLKDPDVSTLRVRSWLR
jgi:hypothetical protein